MRLYALATFLTTLSVCFCKTCELDKETSDRPQEMELRQHLLYCSELEYPPVKKNETAVIVKMNYLLRSFRFDTNEEIITMYSFNYFDWQDDRLSWNPDDFYGIKKTVIMSLLIWTPGLKLINTVEHGDFDFFYARCTVNNTGHVRCAVRADHTVLCKTYSRNWPYDTRLCDLQFDQWRPGEVKVIFNLTYVMFAMDAFQGDGWEIMRGKAFKNLTTGVQSTVKFKLQRTDEALEGTIIVPCFVLAVLTVASLLLDYKGDTRLVMLCIIIVCHFCVSSEICEYLPIHTPDTPVILLFIGSSTVLSVTVLLLSFLFKCLAKRTSQPPMWMTTVNGLTVTSNFKYLVVTTWVDDEDLSDKSRQWNTFIGIVNGLCFLIYVVTYICLFATLMPKKTLPTPNFDVV